MNNFDKKLKLIQGLILERDALKNSLDFILDKEKRYSNLNRICLTFHNKNVTDDKDQYDKLNLPTNYNFELGKIIEQFLKNELKTIEEKLLKLTSGEENV